MTGDPGKWIAGREGVGGGRSTGGAAGQHNLRWWEGPLLRRCAWGEGGARWVPAGL